MLEAFKKLNYYYSCRHLKFYKEANTLGTYSPTFNKKKKPFFYTY